MIAVLFKFVETSFCIINYSMENGGTLEGNVFNEDTVMHLKVSISGDFNYPTYNF